MQGYAKHVQDAPLPTGGPGAFDVVGDVHGCWDELAALLRRLGYRVNPFADPSPGCPEPIGMSHPEGRTLVFAGDLTDRGPRSDLVLRLALGTVPPAGPEGAAPEAAPGALWVLGNHDWKLGRCLKGNKVQVAGGLQSTLDQIAPLGEGFARAVRDLILSLPFQIRLPVGHGSPMAGDGVCTVVHGAAPSHHLDGPLKNSFDRSVYGYAKGTRPDGTLERADWAADYAGPRWIVHGHEAFERPRVLNHVVSIDTGCVWGNLLSAVRVDTGEIVCVPAARNHAGSEKTLVSVR